MVEPQVKTAAALLYPVPWKCPTWNWHRADGPGYHQRIPGQCQDHHYCRRNAPGTGKHETLIEASYIFRGGWQGD